MRRRAVIRLSPRRHRFVASQHYAARASTLEFTGKLMPQSTASMIEPPLAVQMDQAGHLHVDRQTLAARMSRLARGAPIFAMIHGFRFAPGAGQHCPFGHIFALDPCAKRRDKTLVSWPRHLGLGASSGLAIGFGWPARGWLGDVNARAELAGHALAQLAKTIALIDPGRTLDVIGHSMGARVALAALRHAGRGQLRRLILLAAAETRGPALRALRSPAGQAAQVINVTTRENDLFDFLYEWAVAGGRDTAIGQGLGCVLPNWIDVQLDSSPVSAALADLGFALPCPPARICHWSPYIRPGIFSLYRALLDGSLTLETLAARLPDGQTQRWSALSPWRKAHAEMVLPQL